MILSCYLKTIFQLNFKKAILISFCSDFDTFVRLVYMVKGKLILLNRIMKLQPTLLKIVPLVTVVTGIVASMEMANAAGSTAVNNNAHPIEETITAAPVGDTHSEAATVAPVGDTHSEAATAAPVGDTHSEAATAAPVGDTHSEAATAAPHGTSSVTESPLSPRLQQIEFFAFLGAIGLAIVIPELLYRPKKIAQNFLELENSVQEFPQDVFSKTKDTQEHEIEPNLPQEEVQAPQVQLIEFSQATPEVVEEQTASISQETTEVEEQIASISADIPDLKKIIPDNIQPYTIPNRRQSQSDIDGQIEIDNWSQPERKTA